MGNNPRSNLSSGQIMQKVYDAVNDRLRVDAQYTSNIEGELEVSIDSTEDSVTIGDTTGNKVTTTAVGPDVGLDVNIVGGNVTVTVGNVEIKGATDGTLIGNNTNRLLVDGSTVTQPISASTLPLPAGAATSALQTAGNSSLSSLDGKTVHIDTGNVTVISSVLPTGASTEATLSALNTKVITTANGIKVDGSAVTQPVSGSVSVSNFPATQPVSGTITVVQPTGSNLHVNVDNFPATQPVSGTVAVSNFPATQAVTQSTSPWVVSGTVTANAGTGTFQTNVTNAAGASAVNIQDGGNSITVDGIIAATQSGTWNINNISGTISLPTGAATSANQTTSNTSLASIDSKLTAPLSVTPTQASNAWYATGEVATAATTQVQVMKTGFTYTGSNVSAFIASGSANDTLAGTGAQKITITYFKADGSGPFTETDNMQGLTGFFSTNTMAFIQSVVVSQVGSGGSNAGAINIANLVPLSTMANIAIGDNETYYSHHFVPLGKTGYITEAHFSGTSTTAGRSARFFLKKQSIPLASNPVINAVGTIRFEGTSSTDQVIFPTPIKVVGPAVIFTYVIPDSATADTWTFSLGGYEQ